jgi:hypothetical protein
MGLSFRRQAAGILDPARTPYVCCQVRDCNIMDTCKVPQTGAASNRYRSASTRKLGMNVLPTHV